MSRVFVFLVAAAVLGVAWNFGLMYTTLLGAFAYEELNHKKDALWLSSLTLGSISAAWVTRSWLTHFNVGQSAAIGVLQLPIGAVFTILFYGIQDLLLFGMPSFSLIVGFPFLLILSPWILAYGALYGFLMHLVARWSFEPEEPPVEVAT